MNFRPLSRDSKIDNQQRRFVLGLAAMLLVLTIAEPAVACPTCKDSLGLHAIRVQMGYALSIGFMMAVPFGIIVAWTIAIYRMVKNQNAHVTRLQSPSSVCDLSPINERQSQENSHTL